MISPQSNPSIHSLRRTLDVSAKVFRAIRHAVVEWSNALVVNLGGDTREQTQQKYGQIPCVCTYVSNLYCNILYTIYHYMIYIYSIS